MKIQKMAVSIVLLISLIQINLSVKNCLLGLLLILHNRFDAFILSNLKEIP